MVVGFYLFFCMVFVFSLLEREGDLYDLEGKGIFKEVGSLRIRKYLVVELLRVI